LDTAYKWYKLGHDTGLKETDIKPARQDLWNSRWEHAQARIAARRGDQADAQKHVAAAKAILHKGTIPEQALFFPSFDGELMASCLSFPTSLAVRDCWCNCVSIASDLRKKGLSLRSSLQLRVLHLGFFQDGDVGVFPDCEKVFVTGKSPDASSISIAPFTFFDSKALARATPRYANVPVQQFQTMPLWSRIL
jgi:hypothetical protein